MTKQEILAAIEEYITSNGLQGITGPILNIILSSIANIIPDDAKLTSSFGGVVNPSSDITISLGIGRWYIAKAGTYTNYGGFTFLDKNFNILSYNGSAWEKAEILIPESGFVEKAYNVAVDLSKDNYSKYKQITGTSIFTEAAGSQFGKMAFYKLTGGNVSFASNFTIYEGSKTYNPNLTNVIVFWKEYNLVRYKIETFPFEPFPIDPGVISIYNFVGTAGTLLPSITHTGGALIGDVSNHAIVSSGQGLSILNANAGWSNTIGYNLTGTPNFKITLSGLTINGFVDIIINGNSVTDNTKDFFSFDRTKWAHTHNGATSSFTNASTPANSDLIITVNGGLASCTSNGVSVFTNRALTNTNGGFFGILLGDSGISVLQGLKIEVL